MTSYRFLDAMGDLVEEGDFEDHAAALAWARDGDHDEDVQRVEYLGPLDRSRARPARSGPLPRLASTARPGRSATERLGAGQQWHHPPYEREARGMTDRARRTATSRPS